MASMGDITINIDEDSQELLKKTIAALEGYVAEHNRGYWRRLFDAIMGR